ncbi:MAG: short chain dehydrogenase [Sphingobium sp.]|jgi:3-oxoacyl-[acyl-carrier protein] reductase|nr:MAG: short chain dehydrogenase [Sphingobium sp.]
MAEGRLAGLRAFVTGGASGFGEGIVRRFIAEGAKVAIVDRQEDAAQRLAAELDGDATGVAADISVRADVERAAAEAIAAMGGVDILVNNAGVGQTPQPMEELDEALFDRILAVNAKSVYLTAAALLPGMKAAGKGAILNVASTGAVRPRPGLAWYNASKGWMVTATRAMAIELAPFGVRVNAINPVAGATPLLSTFMGEDSDEARARMVASIPLGRLSTPQDMASAATFLCSDEAGMITGIALEVDGGRCI